MNHHTSTQLLSSTRPRASNYYFTEPSQTTESSGLSEEEQGRRVLEVVKMLARCVEETFPEYLPPIPSDTICKKRKYDSVVAPRPPSFLQSQHRLSWKRIKITLPPLKDSSPFATPYPASTPNSEPMSGYFGFAFRPPTFTAPLFEDEGYGSPMFSEHPLGPMLTPRPIWESMPQS